MKQLVKNIRCLAGVEYESKLRLQGKEMAELNTIDDAAVVVRLPHAYCIRRQP